jgi:hypothetical protein
VQHGTRCLFEAWRSVGSPPPDKAVWGRPPDKLPVWRYLITHTTETILNSQCSAIRQETNNRFFTGFSPADENTRLKNFQRVLENNMAVFKTNAFE